MMLERADKSTILAGITTRGALREKPVGALMTPKQPRTALARACSAMEAFRAHIASSEEFARRFDEAVMQQNHRAIIALADEVGLPNEAEVRILEIDADRRVRVEICVLGHCVSITVEW